MGLSPGIWSFFLPILFGGNYMTNKRIQELAEFFYNSNDSNDVPLRISITTGQYSGNDLSPKEFIKLMNILKKSKNLKEDLYKFREEVGNEE